MFILYANKTRLTVREWEPVTSGSVNVYRARFVFSPDWDGLKQKAVFKGSGKQVSVLLDESGECAIPWEVLTRYGGLLMTGVCGAADETTLPTVWATLGQILEGAAADGEPSRPPTPSIWEQELAQKGDRLGYTPGGELGLYSGGKLLNAVPVTGGGSSYGVGHGLKVVGGDLTVDAVDDFKSDKTLPMTAAGVETVVGNIDVLLQTI